MPASSCSGVPLDSEPLSVGQAPVALFDASHGQRNWAQTGFPSREMHSNFAGVMEQLCRLGCRCVTTGRRSLMEQLPGAALLVVPPPTGVYQARRQSWLPRTCSLFTAEEISRLLEFVRAGGRLLLSAYRFGDSFTHTNLRELTAPLGCLLNEDVVVDLSRLRVTHPLEAHFDSTSQCLPLPWSRHGVGVVRWRLMATYTILPGADARPLALSPGGACMCFNRRHRHVAFHSLPVAVAGGYGRGRFVLLGGPHAFETGELGLLEAADNRRFLKNILRWLLGLEKGCDPAEAVTPAWSQELTSSLRELCCIEDRGAARNTIAFLEDELRRQGVLQALNRARWQP